MKNILSLLITLGFIFSASAQTPPNMIGTWTSVVHYTIMGSGSHHQSNNAKDNEIYFDKKLVTMVIDRQEGINFAGTISSKDYKEVILGAIALDFQGGVLVDSDGTATFKIIDSNTMQNCYVQMAKPKVASCQEFKRQ
jgi:hypothetical protein